MNLVYLCPWQRARRGREGLSPRVAAEPTYSRNINQPMSQSINRVNSKVVQSKTQLFKTLSDLAECDICPSPNTTEQQRKTMRAIDEWVPWVRDMVKEVRRERLTKSYWKPHMSSLNDHYPDPSDLRFPAATETCHLSIINLSSENKKVNS